PCFPCGSLRMRTPGPPPFSSMNSTPAASKARLMASSLAAVSDVPFSATSARLIVYPIILAMCPDEFDEDSFVRKSHMRHQAIFVAAYVKDHTVIAYEIDG